MNPLPPHGVAMALALAVLLAACATPTLSPPISSIAPAQWHAPAAAADAGARLPHDGKLTDLSQWWQQQGDPLLVRLIEAAQIASPTIASATSRIAQARAARVASGAALAPSLDAAASINRSSAQPPLPMGTTSQAALQASWEIDVFGGNRAGRDAAQARLERAQAGWHDARVSVAAETANRYYALRACEQLLVIADADAASRGETARLAELSARAGFLAPASVALANASAADGRNRAKRQRAQCEVEIKALVALTAIAELELRQQLAAPTPAQNAPIVIDALPAQTLAQRPDVFAAQAEVAAASADIGAAEAQRYPRLSLSGSIGAANFRADGINTNLSTWSIGPLALNLPLFDGGRRAANVDAARARYEEAAVNYRARVRQAVREVEEALVNLHSTGSRAADALAAVEGYRASFAGTESRYRGGLASLVELEDARRTRLAAENALVALEQERRAAWVALYRAAGGGWNANASALAAASDN